MERVVLLQPPFFRLFGSHNDRMPLHLSYLSAYLKDAGIENVVFNGDATGAKTHGAGGTCSSGGTGSSVLSMERAGCTERSSRR